MPDKPYGKLSDFMPAKLISPAGANRGVTPAQMREAERKAMARAVGSVPVPTVSKPGVVRETVSRVASVKRGISRLKGER